MEEEIILHGQRVDRKTMKDFKKAYLQAVKNNVEEYEWQGQTILTRYAKYVVEYAESRMGKL